MGAAIMTRSGTMLRSVRSSAAGARGKGGIRACYQRSYYSSSTAQRPLPFTRGLIWGTIGAATYYGLTYTFSKTDKKESRLPVVETPASGVEGDIPVTSPVEVLDLNGANEKLRQHVSTFAFDGSEGARGRIDVARVSSNNPVEDDWAVGVAKGPGNGTMVYAGVYDGHVGWATSTVLRKALIPYVSTAIGRLDAASSNGTVVEAIRSAFRSLDDRIMNHGKQVVEAHSPGSAEALSALAPVVAGSCALLTMYEPASSVLRTAVTGDSRAVLGSKLAGSDGFAATALSVDQNGFNPDEVARLNAAHPGESAAMLDPETGRLFGMAITRSFGDHRWKYPLDLLKHLEANFFDTGPRPGYKTPPYMTAEPEVTTRRVGTNDFVILATDGLWDHISNEDAVACVSRWLAARRAGQPEQAKAGQSGSVEMMVAREGFGSWRATPEHFAIEDLDNAAVCLIRNAFGGTRRELFRGVMTEVSPRSRYVRDDVTVQVIFFKDPYQD